VASSSQEACATEPALRKDDARGDSLLQAKSERWTTANSPFIIEGADDQHAKEKNIGLAELAESGKRQAPKGVARTLLPPHLFQAGLTVFDTEEILDSIVANTDLKEESYADVPLNVRIVTGEAFNLKDNYGIANLRQSLDSVGKLQSNSTMLSMLDIGGNYGRISIATFKQFPANLRVIAVEPMPRTHFLLRWNLWLNGVPELGEEEFLNNHSKPGVLALNNGIGNVDEKITGFCGQAGSTMGDRVCNCSKGFTNLDGEHCVNVVSKSLDTLVSMLGVQESKEITFLKMDCEGCELDVIPSLVNLHATTGLRVHRFAGELHNMPNELEDVACKAEQGEWFVSMCVQNKSAELPRGTLLTVPTRDRCKQGSVRESCSRIPYAKLVADRPPPSEWLQLPSI